MARWRKSPGVRAPEWLLSPYTDQGAVWEWMDWLQVVDPEAWDELFPVVLSTPTYAPPDYGGPVGDPGDT